MKYLLSSLIVMLLVASCKKDKDEEDIPAGEDHGCIERIYINTKDHAISSADVAIVDNLFSKNKIDYSTFRYFQYRRDTVQDEYPPYKKRDRKFIRMDQCDRGLRIFKAELACMFYDDTLNAMSRNAVYVSKLDTTPNLSLPRVRKLFRHGLEKNFFPSSVPSNYNDTCFVAEFGFYREVLDKHQTLKFYKAWRVFKKNSVNDRPVGYYDDETGKQLAFYLN